MDDTGDLQVSSRGQMSLPAAARRRWGIQEGGTVAYIDLGDSLLIIPGTIADVRTGIFSSITEEDWERARQGFGDPDLANE